MPHTAATATPVSTMVITMEEKMSLEQLLQQANIDDDDGTALHFWIKAGRQIDRPVRLSGVEVHFFEHPGGRLLDHMQQVLFSQKMIAPSALEIFCFAAINRTVFEDVLRKGSVVVTTPGQDDNASPFMMITLNDGCIVLRRCQQSADFQGCQFAGVCFAPIGD